MSAKRHRSKKYYRFRMENFMSKELHYNNPIVLQRADPYVYRHTDGYYYFTGSVPAYD